ncbi:MAG: hypothetical protein ACE5GJ_09145 [Gemmatimonadota bacterium]
MLPIHRRQDLHDFVAEVMTHTYDRLLTGQRFDVGQAMLKSYLVESHPTAGGSPRSREERFQFLRDGIGPLRGVASETEDARLFTFDIPLEGDDQEPISFVADMEDDRYWTLHTVSSTAIADRLVERLVTERPFLDSAWFPGRYLTAFTRRGKLFKVSVRFNDKLLHASVPVGRYQLGIRFSDAGNAGYFEAPSAQVKPPPTEEEVGQSVSLTLRDHIHLREGLSELDGTRYLRNSINVNRAEMRYCWNGLAEEFSNARIYSWGKITGSGTSAGAHLDLLRQLRRDYRTRVENVERRLGLRTREKRVSGQPINITFRTVPFFENFVFNLFSGSKPFRLTGTPQFRKRDYAVVAALDLHSRQPLRFEITPSYMTVALREGSCGNSIARLYTNILEHLDAGAVIYGGDRNARLFE